MKKGYVIIFLLLASIFLYSCGGTKQEHVHDYSATQVIKPTCEAKGYTEHKCECGDVIMDDYWAALGHDIVKDEMVNPTCLRNGLGEGEHCTRCDYKVEQVVIDRLEHDYDPNTNICNQCNVNKYSINLSFKFDEEAQGYVVQSIGSEINCIITIPATYKSYPVIGIKELAFNFNNATLSYNDQIIEINIPESVTYIGDSAFRNCDNLENINVDENNQYYKSIDGTLYTKDGKTLLVYAIAKKENNLIIPEGVTTIAKYAFYSCQNLEFVTFPESLVDIGKSAFESCYSLKNIKFPNGLKTIAEHAFSGCVNLITLDLPSTLETVGDFAFSGCDYIEMFNIGDNLKPFSNWVIWNSKIKSFNVSENNNYYQSIEGDLYSKDGKTLIAYANGKEQTSYKVSNTVTTIGTYAFCNSNLENIEISDSVTTIEEYAFSYNNKLKDIKFSENLKIIQAYAFGGCSNLVSVTLPNSLETIEKYAFISCSELISVYIGDNTASISPYAFYCENLKLINISKNNQYFSTIDGNVYSKDGTVLYVYATGKDSKNFTVPDHVTTIKEGAIWVHKKLRTIIIPKNVTVVEKNAIYDIVYYLEVYCEASKKPSGYESKWINYQNKLDVKIVWGYTGE